MLRFDLAWDCMVLCTLSQPFWIPMCLFLIVFRKQLYCSHFLPLVLKSFHPLFCNDPSALNKGFVIYMSHLRLINMQFLPYLSSLPVLDLCVNLHIPQKIFLRKSLRDSLCIGIVKSFKSMTLYWKMLIDFSLGLKTFLAIDSFW